MSATVNTSKRTLLPLETAKAATSDTLHRSLGSGFAIAIVIGATIGVGILRTPGEVAARIGDYWLIIALWLAGGIYTLLGALSLSELGTMLPQAGGPYVYVRRAFGLFVGSIVGWCDWISYAAVLALLVTAVAEFSITLLPTGTSNVKPIAVMILLGFSLLQYRGLQVGRRTQELTSIVKVAAFLVLIAGCFFFSASRHSLSSGPPVSHQFQPAQITLVAVVGAMQLVIATYAGWHSAIYFTEEDRDPVRNFPRSLIYGVLLVTGIYVLMNVALLSVLPIPQLATSPLPAAEAAVAMIGDLGGRAITLISIISLLSIINAMLLTSTRILFALSRDRLFFSKAAQVNTNGAPAPAMLISSFTALVLVLTGTFERIVAVASFLLVINYACCFIALIALRQKEPDLLRPYKVWFYPWSTLIVIIVSVAFLVGAAISDTMNSLYAILLVFICIFTRFVLKHLRWR